VFGVEGLHESSDWVTLTKQSMTTCDALRNQLRAMSFPPFPPQAEGKGALGGAEGGYIATNAFTSFDLAPKQLALLDGVSNTVGGGSLIRRRIHCS
jgi:hypothetical protein